MNVSRFLAPGLQRSALDVRSYALTILPVVALALVSLAYMLGSPSLQSFIYNSSGFVALGIFTIRLWRERDQGIGPGALLTLGIAFLAFGDLTYFHHELLFGGPAGFPGIPDLLYQLGGIGIVAALAVMIVRAQADRADGIDAALVLTMLAIVAWFFLIKPYATDPSLSAFSKVASVAFPATSVLIFGMVSLVILARARLTRTSLWLIAGFVLYYGADVIYVRQAIDGTYQGGWLDLGWVLGYGCWAIAALCNSPILRAAPERPPAPLNRKRILWLTSVGLVGPAVLVVSSKQHIDIDASELVVWCVFLFFLALLRMGLLASALDKQRTELVHLVTQLEEANTDRRKLLAAVLNASEVERSKLAAELHDGSIQHLSAINLELELALMALAELDGERATDCVLSAQEGIQRETAALRTVMRDLRPPALDTSGLQAAMEDYGRAFTEREGVACLIDSNLDPGIAPFAATILYRLFQEALGNAGTDPLVTSVHVSIQQASDQILLDISDDGPWVGTPVRGSGHLVALDALRERIEMAGGALRIVRAPSGGTLVQAALPLSTKEEADDTSEAIAIG